MRVKNVHTAVLTVGKTSIKPGAEADISADDAKRPAVQSWLRNGKMVDASPVPKAASKSMDK